ncbi:RHS repeat domain-containing protein [Glaciecola sp. KUL10]|uniref:RHS repeat domain-containing protein n=1 Tax=Glaciecola sp. (strain KUL10) TaxID=2161813 RepID=UPI000D782932|nr:RHS repeat-associated core domain-containing protein [Glaciecola sp. KUL10]GBL06326.1 integrins alpha chain [Glaciecola sp. KUL10]
MVTHKRYRGSVQSGAIKDDLYYQYDSATLGNDSTLAAGLLHSIEDKAKRSGSSPRLKQVFSYDNLARQDGIEHNLEGRVYSQSTGFDSIGRVAWRLDAAGGRVNRFYNQYGYHYASQDANSDVVYYHSKTQDAFGNVTSYSLHNDVTEGLARYEDETGLVDTLQVSGNASIQHEEYDWDVLGNLRNGKTVDGNTRNIHYTLFDKPTLIEVNSTQTHFAYGVDTTRYKRIDIDAHGERSTTWYIGSVEFVEKGAQVTTKRHIDGVVQVISQSNASNTSADHLEYVYQIKDHLGSIVATVNHTGAQLKRYSYDAWGQRRGTDWSIPGHTPSSISGFTGLTSNLPIQISQTRGFTGHEHVDNAGLIHMNGRIYDPVLGRFMSADPYIQAATNAQSLNRYSYVWNNPLNATDPSGYVAHFLVAWAVNWAQGYLIGQICHGLKNSLICEHCVCGIQHRQLDFIGSKGIHCME